MPDIKCSYCGIKIVPAELDFEVEENWPYVPNNQVMHVKREGSGELSPIWKATIDADWVELSPNVGDVPKNIVVRVKSIGKPVGNYMAIVTFNSESATNAPQYATVKLTVKPKPKPLKIITPSLPDGETNKAYECQIEAEGGVQPYKWAWIGLPDELVFDSQTARITGTPTSGGVFSINITVQDSNLNSDTMEYMLNIAEPPAPPAPPVKIVIMSPIGGEVWYKGDTEDITWVAENADDETLDIHLILNGVARIIATDVPVKSLGYLWTISGIPVSENAAIMLLTNYQAVQCPPFAIRERSGCLPWPVARVLKKVRKLVTQYRKEYLPF